MRDMIRRELNGITYEMAVRAIAGQPFAHLLCGGQFADHAWGGHWDYIVANPSQTFEVRDNKILINGQINADTAHLDPFKALNDIVVKRQLASSPSEELPAFLSGLVGHVSYEMAAYLEPVLNLHGRERANMAFGIYDAVAAWDRATGCGYIFARSELAADQLHDVFFAE